MKRKIQLFCMPFAGGESDFFEELDHLLGEEIEINSFEYAGHGKRRGEAFYLDFNDMVEDAAEFIRQNHDQNCEFALFGYSMGSIVVYELLAGNYLEENPQYVFLASHEAPDQEWEAKNYSHLTDGEFVAILKKMGGLLKVDDKVMTNRFFIKLYLEPIRQDYRLLTGYKMSKKIVIPCPVVMFYSPEDIPDECIHGWDSFFPEQHEVIAIGDNHFFIKQYADRVAAIMRGRLINEDGK